MFNAELLNILIYLGIAGAVTLTCVFGVKLLKTKQDKDIAILILKAIDYIAGNTNVKIKAEIRVVIKYCLDAVNTIEKYNSVTDFEEKKALIKQKAIDICKENDIVVSMSMINIIEEAILFFVNDKV